MLRNKRSISTRRKLNGRFFFSVISILSILTFLIHITDKLLNIGVTKYSNPLLITIILSMITIQFLVWLTRNKAYKGIRFAFFHYFTVLNLRKVFLDSNYYNVRFYFNKKIARLPKIKIESERVMSMRKIYIENINMDKDLLSSNISIALNRYVVESSYLTRDEKYYVFEIYFANMNRQITFKDSAAFKKYASYTDEGYLFIDKITKIPIHSTLFVGQTGSGKTYALYSLILQMLLKRRSYELYFADPKNSSLSVIGEKIAPHNSATDFDDIVKLLKHFNELMHHQKFELKEKLSIKLDATYADFGYPAHVLIFDEFASFQTQLQSMEKKKRDEVMSLISKVVLEGRQLGFFIWFVMQKSDSNLIPTYIRENLPVKFVIGNAEKQTYVTAFGSGTTIKGKDFQLGEGLFTCPLVANEPTLCHFSYLDFDILEAVKELC